MKSDQHLYVKAEITAEDHKTAVHMLRNLLSVLDHQGSHPDERHSESWSDVTGSVSLLIEVRDDKPISTDQNQ